MKKMSGNIMAVILDDGEHPAESLVSALEDGGMDSALVISGIGMLRNARIGFWNGSEYEMKDFREPRELLSMSGSVALLDGNPSVHLHVSLAERDHNCAGGHLVDAEVNNINEIAIASFPSGSFVRKYSGRTKLNMLDFTQ